MRSLYHRCLFAAVMMLPSLALAQTSTDAAKPPDPAPAAPPSGYWGKIKYSGLLDVNVNKNFNNPSSGVNLLQNFDVRSNQADVNYAEFVLEHDAEPVGFRIDIGGGRTSKIVHGGEQAGDAFRYIQQVYLTAKPFKGKGFQVDVGKFVTAAGAEVIETNGNWNYSRSLLFAWAIPYYHLGVRTTVPINKFYTAGFQLLNGWNNVKDNNSGKTFAYTGTLTVGKVQWFHNYFVGPEKADTNNGVRNLFDTTVLVNPNKKTAFYLNLDVGADKRLTSGGDKWYGIAAAARFAVTNKFAIAPRVEWFKDSNGFATGAAQSLKEFTLTGEYKLLDGYHRTTLLSRLEYRSDWSDQPFFEKDNGVPTKRQNMIVFGLIAYFESKR